MTNNITFNENNNIDEMVSLGIEQVPIIKLEDNTLLDYNEALKWISSYDIDDNKFIPPVIKPHPLPDRVYQNLLVVH